MRDAELFGALMSTIKENSLDLNSDEYFFEPPGRDANGWGIGRVIY